MRHSLCFFACLLIATITARGQSTDTTQTRVLKQVVVQNQLPTSALLPPVKAGFITEGKKSEVILVQNMDANIAQRTPRQIFAKVPGVFVYDMDGAGNQINISTRGLDPHRGWEFNVRQNGIITNSDMYGYPASHFTIPMEAVERIELIRGTGALQYGAQFGGMLNYITKRPDTSRIASGELVGSIASFGTSSLFGSIGGKVGKWQYYAYYNKRVSDGYRDNSSTDFDAQMLQLVYQPSDRFTLTTSVARSNYIYQLPGPLNDSLFYDNPRQSTRSRNYYSPDIIVPSLVADWRLAPRTRLMATVSAVLGSRSSVMLDKPVTTLDVINPATDAYAARQVDIDRFNSYTSEIRLLQDYKLGAMGMTLVAGVQLMNNDLHRRQLGVGTTGSDYDLSISAAGFVRDLHFKTQNIAVFAEQNIHLSPRWSVSPGIRYEDGASKMQGTIAYYDPNNLPKEIAHRFPLLGINTEYKTGVKSALYAGWSQAYRPVIFKDIIPASVYEKTDDDLKDAYGYNMEAGFRGSRNGWRWDVSGFRLLYNNRLGNLATQENGFTILRTNIGNSVTHGVEFLLEYSAYLTQSVRYQIFTSTSWFDARYTDANVRVGQENRDVSGNKVEGVPDWISRNGFTLGVKRFSFSVLHSYTGASFADALNTEKPNATGAVGLVPSYNLVDLNLTWRITPTTTIRLNCNNLFDKQYFTKRPTFYPGPGIWPSDGRSLAVSIGTRI